MATLSVDRMKKRKRRKRRIFLIITAIELTICPMLVYLIHQVLTRIGKGNLSISTMDYSYLRSILILFQDRRALIIFFFLQVVFVALWIYATLITPQEIANIDMMQITDKIMIPVPAGNGQYGNERFLTESEKKELFNVFVYTGKENEKPEGLGGLVVHFERKKDKEIIYYIGDDKHGLIIGTSGSGKTRRILLETLWLQILSGMSVVISDVKGEIYYFTHLLAEKMGYITIAFDLRNPKKSVHYNFLQPILDELRNRDIAKAIDYTWDLVSVLVGQPKGEPLWTNGESATLAAGILIVAMDAPEGYKNLTNVYYFIANMCKPGEYGELPLTKYLEELKDTHPARGVFAMAEIAPHKTRSSFFTSALGTLRLFTNPNIAEMTSKSDFNLKDIGKKKTIFYMMIPDEKKTNYPIVSLLLTQMYALQVEVANENGQVLPVPTDYDLDEVGNFPFIPTLAGMASAGRSRGTRLNLIIQDEQQLESKYKEEYKNIKTNCQVKMFLKSDEPGTVKNFSESLGKYTVEVSSASTGLSDGKKTNVNYSSSASLAGRPLLDIAELERVDQPYAICKVMGNFAGVNYLPDLSEYRLNSLYGLKDKEYNRNIIEEREKERPENYIPEIKLWTIWKEYEETSDSEQQAAQGRASFLN